MTENQKLEERIAAAEAAEARALEAAAKAEEAAKKATEEREKIEALQKGQTIPAQTTQQPQTTQPQVVYVNPSQNAIELQNAQGLPAQTTQQPITQPQVQPTVQLPEVAQGTEEVDEPVKLSVRERYYKKSGTNFLSVASVGYSTVFLTPNRTDGLTPTEFAGKRHFINFEILEWRTKLFGMQMFNFEIGVNTPGWTEGGTYLTKLMSGGEPNYTGYGSGLAEANIYTMWFAYKPAIKFYIPCSDWLAIELYGGVEIDLTTAWSRINPNYYKYNKDIPNRNYFIGAYGGLGLMLTPAPVLPIEIKAEYRGPVHGNIDIVPQGFYLSTQLHIGAPIRKTQKNKK